MGKYKFPTPKGPFNTAKHVITKGYFKGFMCFMAKNPKELNGIVTVKIANRYYGFTPIEGGERNYRYTDYSYLRVKKSILKNTPFIFTQKEREELLRLLVREEKELEQIAKTWQNNKIKAIKIEFQLYKVAHMLALGLSDKCATEEAYHKILKYTKVRKKPIIEILKDKEEIEDEKYIF